MKPTALALLLSLAALPAAGQHVLATTFVDIGDGQSRPQLVDINPATGVSTLVGEGPFGAASMTGISAYDAAGNRFFVLGTPPLSESLSLFIVDATDGSFLSGPITGTFDTVIDIEYDPSGGTLYALLSVGGIGQKRLASVDITPPVVGALTLLGSGPFSGGAAIPSDGLAELDPTLNRYYFRGGDLYGVNTVTADVFDSGATSNLIQGLEPDADSGVLYALQVNGSNRRLVVVSTLDATFGTVTTTGPDLGAAGISTAGQETSDSAGNRYYFLGIPDGGGLSIYSVITTNQTLANPAQVLTGQIAQLANLEFDDVLPVSARKGDLNRDKATDLILRNTSTNQADAWMMLGTTRTDLVTFTPTPVADQVIAGADDFNGDGINDLAVYRPSLGTVEFWVLGGANGTDRQGAAVPLTGAAPLASNWKLSATGDFTHDGHPDLVWRNTTSQKIVVWTLTGTAKTGSFAPDPDQAVNANWEIVAALDFNGDGNRDFLWYNSSSGNIVTWNMNASAVRIDGNFTAPANAGNNNWKVVAGGDYGIGPDGSDPAAPLLGTKDIVWRNDTSGRFVVWHLDFNRQRTAGLFTTPMEPATNPTQWIVSGPR